jgi:hypothetical protein
MPKLKMPPNCVDVSALHRGEIISLVGAEVFRRAIIGIDRGDKDTDLDTLPYRRKNLAAI